MKLLKQKKAHTLIEVIVTTVVFSIGILGILAAFSFSSQNSATTDDKLLAANRGRELLENLRSKVDSRTWETTWPLNCDGLNRIWTDETFDGEEIRYTCNEDNITGTRQVTVTLTWTD